MTEENRSLPVFNSVSDARGHTLEDKEKENHKDKLKKEFQKHFMQIHEMMSLITGIKVDENRQNPVDQKKKREMDNHKHLYRLETIDKSLKDIYRLVLLSSRDERHLYYLDGIYNSLKFSNDVQMEEREEKMSRRDRFQRETIDNEVSNVQKDLVKTIESKNQKGWLGVISGAVIAGTGATMKYVGGKFSTLSDMMTGVLKNSAQYARTGKTAIIQGATAFGQRKQSLSWFEKIHNQLNEMNFQNLERMQMQNMYIRKSEAKMLEDTRNQKMLAAFYEAGNENTYSIQKKIDELTKEIALREEFVKFTRNSEINTHTLLEQQKKLESTLKKIDGFHESDMALFEMFKEQKKQMEGANEESRMISRGFLGNSKDVLMGFVSVTKETYKANEIAVRAGRKNLEAVEQQAKLSTRIVVATDDFVKTSGKTLKDIWKNTSGFVKDLGRTLVDFRAMGRNLRRWSSDTRTGLKQAAVGAVAGIGVAFKAGVLSFTQSVGKIVSERIGAQQGLTAMAGRGARAAGGAAVGGVMAFIPMMMKGLGMILKLGSLLAIPALLFFLNNPDKFFDVVIQTFETMKMVFENTILPFLKNLGKIFTTTMVDMGDVLSSIGKSLFITIKSVITALSLVLEPLIVLFYSALVPVINVLLSGVNVIMQVVITVAAVLNVVGQFLKPIVDALGEFFNQISNFFGFLEEIFGDFNALILPILAFVGFFAKTIGQVLGGLIRVLGTILSLLVGYVSAFLAIYRGVSKFFARIFAVFDNLFKNIATVGLFSALGYAIKDFLWAVVMFPIDILKHVLNSFLAPFGVRVDGFFERFFSFFSNLFSNIWEGMKAFGSMISNAFWTVIDWFLAIPRAIGRIITTLIENIMGAVVRFFLRRMLGSVVQTILSPFIAIGGFFKNIRDRVGGVLQNLRDAIMSPFDRLVDFFGGIRDWFSSFFDRFGLIVRRVGSFLGIDFDAVMGRAQEGVDAASTATRATLQAGAEMSSQAVETVSRRVDVGRVQRAVQESPQVARDLTQALERELRDIARERAERAAMAGQGGNVVSNVSSNQNTSNQVNIQGSFMGDDVRGQFVGR